MRYHRDISGLQRIRTKNSYRPNGRRAYSPIILEKQESEDTKKRKEIYKKVVDMINQNENNIKIECVLREQYPDYANLIASIVNDQFAKRKTKKEVDSKDTEIGEER